MSCQTISIFLQSSNKYFEVRNLKIITISGAKNTKKDELAQKLAQNSAVVYVKPYTDAPEGVYEWEMDEHIHLNPKQLDAKLNRENALTMTNVNSHRYVFFENQLNADYCILILDDTGLINLKRYWEGEMVTIRVHSKDEKYSERNVLDDDYFDVVFDVDYDDYDVLEGVLGHDHLQ